MVKNDQNQGLLAFLAGLMGVFLSVFWFLNHRSYKQLNSGKFAVILELEKLCPSLALRRNGNF